MPDYMKTQGSHGARLVTFAAQASLIGPNERRVALIISAPVTNRVTINMGGEAILDSGITIMPGSNPLVLDRNTYGDAIMAGVNAISAVADQTIGFWEVIDAA